MQQDRMTLEFQCLSLCTLQFLCWKRTACLRTRSKEREREKAGRFGTHCASNKSVCYGRRWGVVMWRRQDHEVSPGFLAVRYFHLDGSVVEAFLFPKVSSRHIVHWKPLPFEEVVKEPSARMGVISADGFCLLLVVLAFPLFDWLGVLPEVQFFRVVGWTLLARQGVLSGL